MSNNRYMIKILHSYGDKSLTFKLKTIVGNKEQFIEEIIKHIDWEDKLNLLEKQESHEIQPCMCDFQ